MKQRTAYAVEKQDPSFAVGKNVNWWSYCGNQFGESLKN